MANNQRNNIFAAFLKTQQVGSPKNIIDVACGDGRLTVALSKLFPFASVVGVDPKPRGNKRRIRFLRGRFPGKVKINEYDLIVGMHPDEATWGMVEESCKHRYAETNNMQVISTTLKMRGANHVVMGIPR